MLLGTPSYTPTDIESPSSPTWFLPFTSHSSSWFNLRDSLLDLHLKKIHNFVFKKYLSPLWRVGVSKDYKSWIHEISRQATRKTSCTQDAGAIFASITCKRTLCTQWQTLSLLWIIRIQNIKCFDLDAISDTRLHLSYTNVGHHQIAKSVSLNNLSHECCIFHNCAL